MDPQFHFSRNYYKLKLVHDVNERDICPRGGRRGKCRGGSRGRGCIHRLHTRPLCSQLRCTPPNRLLANGNHDMEERRGRNGDVHVCEDACDSQRKDELIMCSCVLKQSIIDTIMCEEKSIERFSMRERRKQSRGSMMVL